MSDVSGSIFSVYSSITEYFSLKEENKKLSSENAKLRNQLKSSFYASDSTDNKQDTIFKYLSAKIVSNSISKPNNYLMINKGNQHGVKEEMGVISSSGIAGIVLGTSENYAVVMSVLHQNTRISGRLKRGGQLVNIIWPGLDYRTCKVIDIPSHVQLFEGDTVVTSGNSLIFPKDILIGTIVRQEVDENRELSEALLELSTDFSTLKHVYIIQNTKREEQNLLIEKIKENE